jgi:hypothetical protein
LRSAVPPLYPLLELPKLELCFKDGQRIWLRAYTSDPLVRSIDYQGEALRVDLREISAELAHCYDEAVPLDKPGVIFFTLRHQFKTLDAFINAVRARGNTPRATDAGHVSTHPTGELAHG